HHPAHGPTDARAHQATGPLALPQLPKHDETMDQRTHGRRTARTRERPDATETMKIADCQLPIANLRARPASRRKQAFTLIEMLVVIAIIGILAALIVGLT